MARFDAARLAAVMADLVRPLLGRPTDLLPFDEVREGLRLRHFVDRGLVEVPLDRIVGTLGRAREFNRAFLPRDEALRERWEDVEDLAEGPAGFPPVELYQVDEAYFVVDGHHRVSVARSLGAQSIEAWVKRFDTPFPLAPEDSIEDVLLHAGLADFLECTGLPAEMAERFRVSVANGYERLLDHVKVHRYFLGLEWQRPFTWEEAVASWRDTLFLPTVEAIGATGVLADFPGRSEADLYLFVMDHLHRLRERYGGAAVATAAAVDALRREEGNPEGKPRRRRRRRPPAPAKEVPEGEPPAR